jgi:hypothetical protein
MVLKFVGAKIWQISAKKAILESITNFLKTNNLVSKELGFWITTFYGHFTRFSTVLH